MSVWNWLNIVPTRKWNKKIFNLVLIGLSARLALTGIKLFVEKISLPCCILMRLIRSNQWQHLAPSPPDILCPISGKINKITQISPSFLHSWDNSPGDAWQDRLGGESQINEICYQADQITSNGHRNSLEVKSNSVRFSKETFHLK